jgi:hypothetical protein
MDSHDCGSLDDRPAGDENEGALAGLSVSYCDDPAAECRKLTGLLRSGDMDAFMEAWREHIVSGAAYQALIDAGLLE